jgi:hypothetical protein
MDKVPRHARLTGRFSGAEEFILSGTYMCVFSGGGSGVPILNAITWVLAIVWEVLALCLAIRIVIIHFRDLRRTSAGSPIGDCFMVLIRTHVFYFALWVLHLNAIISFYWSSELASFAAVSCFNLGWLSPNITVRQFVADIYIRSHQNVSVGIRFCRRCDLLWRFSDCFGSAAVCAGASPHSQRESLEREARSQLRWRSWNEYSCFSGGHTQRVNRRQCVGKLNYLPLSGPLLQGSEDLFEVRLVVVYVFAVLSCTYLCRTLLWCLCGVPNMIRRKDQLIGLGK